MRTSGIDDFDGNDPLHLDEVQALIDKLGECIIDEVLFKVNQELGKLDTTKGAEGAFEASQLIENEIAGPPEGYTLQDPARYDDSVPKTLLHLTEIKKVNDSTTNVDVVFGPSAWQNTHESGKGVPTGQKESSTAKLIFGASPERSPISDESRELFLLKELLRQKKKPPVFEPAPKRKKKEPPKVEKSKFSSPSEFNLDHVGQIRMKPGKSVNR